MRSAFFFLVVFVAVSASAQQTAVVGPVEGFTFDLPTMSVRPVTGSIGSASLGTPVFGRISYGSVAPQQNYALVFHDEKCSVLSGLGLPKTAMRTIPGSFVLPEGVAWSGDGSTAVLYSKTASWIQVLLGLPNSVNAGPVLSTASLGGALSSVAIDAHGAQIAIGIVGGNAGVYQVLQGGSFVPLASFSKPVALGFSYDTKTLYGVDAGTQQIFALTIAGLASETWALSGLTDPIAIQSAQDGSNRAVIYVAGASDHLLQSYDAASHELIASVQLNFQPNLIERLGTNTFLLESRTTGDDLVWSFRNTPQPRVYFVPAPPVESRESARK